MEAILDALVGRGDATLIVLSPDAVRSGLVDSLIQFIQGRTECRIIGRGWLQHTADSIAQFYIKQAGASEAYRLVERLFLTGPSYATVWCGPNAGAVLPSLKGATHPAQALPGTIRSQFWCDTEVTNLVHVSDGPTDVRRELRILRGAGLDLFGEEPRKNTIRTPARRTVAPRHNGILMVCAVARRIAELRGRSVQSIVLPSDATGRSVVRAALPWLSSLTSLLPCPTGYAIERFLSAEITPAAMIDKLLVERQLSSWEDLLVRAAVLARAGWKDIGS